MRNVLTPSPRRDSPPGRGPPGTTTGDGGYPVDADLHQMSDDGCPHAPDPARWADPDWRDNLGEWDTFDPPEDVTVGRCPATEAASAPPEHFSGDEVKALLAGRATLDFTTHGGVEYLKAGLSGHGPTIQKATGDWWRQFGAMVARPKAPATRVGVGPDPTAGGWYWVRRTEGSPQPEVCLWDGTYFLSNVPNERLVLPADVAGWLRLEPPARFLDPESN